MSQATLLSVAEYLNSSWHPDREFIDGELKERNVGEFDHSQIQHWLSVYFGRYQDDWEVAAGPEQRVQVSASRFRVPDFCVTRHRPDLPQVYMDPPLLAIEVLSQNDSPEDLEDKVEDYLQMGIPHVWVIGPRTQRAWIYTSEGRSEVRDGILRATPPIEVPLDFLFRSKRK